MIAIVTDFDRYDSQTSRLSLTRKASQQNWFVSDVLDWRIERQSRFRSSFDPDSRRLVHSAMRPVFLYVATTAGSLLVGTAILTGSTALTITTVRSAVILKKVRLERMVEEKDGDGGRVLTLWNGRTVQRIKNQVCQTCSGRKVTACESCHGKGVIAFAPSKGAALDPNWKCPMCLGRKAHKCFNCLGYGVM